MVAIDLSPEKSIIQSARHVWDVSAVASLHTVERIRRDDSNSAALRLFVGGAPVLDRWGVTNHVPISGSLVVVVGHLVVVVVEDGGRHDHRAGKQDDKQGDEHGDTRGKACGLWVGKRLC